MVSFLFCKGDGEMKVLRDQLREWKSNQNKERRQTRKRKEKFSTREIEELMEFTPRYERRRGALRQK